MPLGLQLGEQHLFVAQAIGKKLLLERIGLRLCPRKQSADLQLLPPGTDHGAAGEQR